MSHHSLYDVATGELTGLSMQADAALRALNTPPGHAWVAGQHDPRRCIVARPADGPPVVQPRTPPRPPDTALQTWAWSEAQADWVATPTLALRQRTERARLQAAFSPLDASLARPLAELVEAQALGQPVPAAALARLRALQAHKAQLRQRLAAVDAAASTAALEQLLAEPLPEPPAP